MNGRRNEREIGENGALHAAVVVVLDDGRQWLVMR